MLHYRVVFLCYTLHVWNSTTWNENEIYIVDVSRKVVPDKASLNRERPVTMQTL